MPLVPQSFSQIIDFTRTSAATYVANTGFVTQTPASRNLLTYTQEFDNAAWTKTRSTVTADSTVAPDGTSTADKVIANSDANYHAVQRSFTFSSGVAVFSIYAKAAEYSLFRMFDINNGDFAASFDLTNGTVSNTGGPRFLSASAVAVGNGWYRCTLTVVNVNAARSPGFIGYPAGATLDFYGANYTGDNTSGVFAWGAQLEAVPDANLVLGSELVSNGDFASGSTGWIVPTGWAVGSGVATASATNASLRPTSAVTDGKTYRVAFDVTSYTSGTLYVRVGTGTAQTVTGTGSKVLYLVASNTAGVEFYGGGITLSIDNISVKEITGTTGMPTTYTRNVGGVYPPRFDYDPVTLAPRGLLIEEQRTNLLTYSEQFDNAAWAKAATTITANAATSPDGTANADMLVEDTANAQHFTYAGSSVVSGTVTFSVYAKFAGRRWMRMSAAGSSLNVWFDLVGGVLGTVDAGATATITSAGNGWYRCTVTATYVNTINYIFLADANNSILYTGDGTSGIYLWGAQLEAGTFATSYIPTVASQVTRTADVAAINAPNFAPWYNQSEGTFVVEADTVKPTTSTTLAVPVSVSGNGGVTANSVNVRFVGSKVDVTCYADSSLVVDANGFNYTPGNTTKSALALKANDFALAVSGSSPEVDTNAAVPVVSQMFVGQASNGSQINGHIRSIRYYPTRLSNAQLQALTA